MAAIVDTNVLMRVMIMDSPAESIAAQAFVENNDIIIPTQVFCEMVWVLRRLYKLKQADIIEAVSTWMSVRTAVFDRPAVEAGLAFLEAGGDFADGVIEFEGRRLGGETFATFDRRAAAIIESQGRKGLLLVGD